jgi:hypothetical protein
MHVKNVTTNTLDYKTGREVLMLENLDVDRNTDYKKCLEISRHTVCRKKKMVLADAVVRAFDKYE